MGGSVRRFGLGALCVGALIGCGTADEVEVSPARSEARAPQVAVEGSAEVAADEASGARAAARRAWGRLPLRYEENRGQVDARARYVARQGGLSLFAADGGLVLALRSAVGEAGDADAGRLGATPSAGPSLVDDEGEAEAPAPAWYGLGLRLEGARADVRPEGRRRMATRSNYLIGDDPSEWRTGVPSFEEVVYRELAAGGGHGAPRLGGRARRVRPGGGARGVAGADGDASRARPSVRLADDGAVEVETGHGVLRQLPAVAYQEVGGRRRSVEVRYRIDGPASVTFEVGAYDAREPLVIDPVLDVLDVSGGDELRLRAGRGGGRGGGRLRGGLHELDGLPDGGGAAAELRGLLHRVRGEADAGRRRPGVRHLPRRLGRRPRPERGGGRRRSRLRGGLDGLDRLPDRGGASAELRRGERRVPGEAGPRRRVTGLRHLPRRRGLRRGAERRRGRIGRRVRGGMDRFGRFPDRVGAAAEQGGFV